VARRIKKKMMLRKKNLRIKKRWPFCLCHNTLCHGIRNEKLIRVLWFLIKFNIFAIPLYIIMITGFVFYGMQEFVANIVSFLLNSTGIPASLSGINIIIPVLGGFFSAEIIWDCVGWKSLLAFFALVFATDLSLRKKLWAMTLLPVIFVINIIRLWFMFFYVYNFGLDGYSFVHAVVWSWGLIITIVILWILWLRWASKTCQ